MASPIFAKVAANLFDNDKFRGITPGTFKDWVRLMLFCVRNESDGFISRAGANDELSQESICEMITLGLLHEANLNTVTGQITFCAESQRKSAGSNEESSSRDNSEYIQVNLKHGYVMHDYTDHQTPKAYIEDKRRRDRERKQKFKETSTNLPGSGWSSHAE